MRLQPPLQQQCTFRHLAPAHLNWPEGSANTDVKRYSEPNRSKLGVLYKKILELSNGI